MVDITDQIERKLDVIAAYASQFEGATGGGEVYPAGTHPLLDQIRSQMARYGSLIRTGYGEPYRIDEAIEVDELTALRVSTF